MNNKSQSSKYKQSRHMFLIICFYSHIIGASVRCDRYQRNDVGNNLFNLVDQTIKSSSDVISFGAKFWWHDSLYFMCQIICNCIHFLFYLISRRNRRYNIIHSVWSFCWFWCLCIDVLVWCFGCFCHGSKNTQKNKIYTIILLIWRVISIAYHMSNIILFWQIVDLKNNNKHNK